RGVWPPVDRRVECWRCAGNGLLRDRRSVTATGQPLGSTRDGGATVVRTPVRDRGDRGLRGHGGRSPGRAASRLPRPATANGGEAAAGRAEHLAQLPPNDG